MNLRRHRKQRTARKHGDHDIDQRSSHGDADIPFPREQTWLDRLLGFIEQRDSANGQQDDGFGRNPGAHAHQRVSQFVQHHTAENDSHQGQTAAGVGGTMRG